MNKIKIIFVCHGNICRSPLGKFIFTHLVKEKGCEDKFIIDSAATSTEAVGEDIDPRSARQLELHNIPYTRHCARQITKEDYDSADIIIIMDENNKRNILRMFDDRENKIQKLLDTDIEDPWYTGRFPEVYDMIYKGCEKLLYNTHHSKIYLRTV